MNLQPLMKPAGQCFHGIQADADAALDALAPLGREEGAVLRHLRGTRMGSPRQLFDEWAAVLQFPAYFGENWNALDECLNDLDWLPVGPCTLVILDADCVLDRSTDDDLECLARILKEAAIAWNGSRAFHVVFHWGPEACEPGLALQLRKLGVSVLPLVIA